MVSKNTWSHAVLVALQVAPLGEVDFEVRMADGTLTYLQEAAAWCDTGNADWLDTGELSSRVKLLLGQSAFNAFALELSL